MAAWSEIYDCHRSIPIDLRRTLKCTDQGRKRCDELSGLRMSTQALLGNPMPGSLLNADGCDPSSRKFLATLCGEPSYGSCRTSTTPRPTRVVVESLVNPLGYRPDVRVLTAQDWLFFLAW